MHPDKPYLTVTTRVYNPDYGDDRVCECGHTYYRHFDTYEDMRPIGCKYCSCRKFIEGKNGGRLALIAEVYNHVYYSRESFEQLGMQLAYLLGAIAKQGYVQLDEDDTLRACLKELGEDHPVWDYVVEDKQ